MNISLDEEIKKDRQRERDNRDRNGRHRYDNNRNYNNRGRYSERYNDRHSHHRQGSHHRQTRTVINISNLHYSVTRQQLQELCENYGRVKNCRIQWDKMGRSNQKATVEYFSKADSQNAVDKLKGAVFEQQPIQVELVEQDNMPAKRHEIRKNYGNRFRQYSSNFRTGGPKYK